MAVAGEGHRRRLLARILASIGTASTLSSVTGACGAKLESLASGIAADDSSSDARDATDDGEPHWSLCLDLPVQVYPGSSPRISRCGPATCAVTLKEAEHPECGRDPQFDGGRLLSGAIRELICLAPPPSGSCASDYPTDCVLDAYRCGLSDRAQYIACGPMRSADGACCYVVAGNCPIGRPLVIDGVARTPEIVETREWACDLRPSLAGLEDGARRALAEYWAREGAAEHAAVAAFARFAIQLAAVGAPAGQLADTSAAMADEVRHAQACFSLASAYAGRPVGPGVLDVRGALDGAIDLATVAANVAREGCVAETVSALQLRAAAAAATEPTLRAVLERMAEDEAAHAALAWRHVAWAVERGGDAVRAAVSAVFVEAHRHVGFGACIAEAVPQDVLREKGYLPLGERRELANLALTEVIAPAAHSLLTRDMSLRSSSAPS